MSIRLWKITAQNTNAQNDLLNPDNFMNRKHPRQYND